MGLLGNEWHGRARGSHSHTGFGQKMSNACLKSIGISEFPLCFLRKPYDCLEVISNYRRHCVLKIILPSQARPNKSKPKVKCSAVWGKGHWIRKPEAQPIVSCFVILYHLSVAMVVMCKKTHPHQWHPMISTDFCR